MASAALKPNIEEVPVAVLIRLRDSAVRRRHQKYINANSATAATPPTQPPAIAPVGIDCIVGAGEIAGFAIALGMATPEDIGGFAIGELVREGTIVEVDDSGDEEVEVDAGLLMLEFSNAAAIAGFEDKKPAVRSPTGQPAVQGPVLQHPINGGEVYAQVYHSLPVGHSWSGKSPQ